MTRLNNKVVVITGGALGIGKATAKLFAREGARVVIADIDTDAAAATIQEITASGGEARFIRTDVLRSDDLRQMIDFAVSSYGRLDVLFNNAFGEGGDGSAIDVTEESWERHFRIILTAAFTASKLAIPHMAEAGGGSIISTSSIHGVLPSDQRVCYTTCKAGLMMLMKQLAVDYGPMGIRANAICPGFVSTEGMQKYLDADPWKVEWRSQIQALRRLCRPEDVANVALFLASDESSMITGQALVVDGGLTIQLQDFMAYRIRDMLLDQAPEKG